jgi:hypothetical protein
VQSIGQTPELSAGLRARVLTAAVESRRRRSYGRRALCAAGLVVLCAGLTAWRAPLTTFGRDLAGRNPAARDGETAGRQVAALPAAAAGPSSEPSAYDSSAYNASAPLLNVSARYGRGELLLSAAGDDWRLVEAELHSRREGVRHLRLSF